MVPKTDSTRIVIDKNKANINTIARAALEMTSWCYVWLERTSSGTAVNMTLKGGEEQNLKNEFEQQLERIIAHEKNEQQTRLIRSAIVARALGPHTAKAQQSAQAPALDAETEAEIEKLLAEIEGEDWLDDAGDIAKTWEERFGGEGNEES